MIQVRPILIGFIGGLALGINVRADDNALPGDPYAVVVTRNIFGLNPPPPPGPPTDATPPPKITPNGTMDIFGQLQVLFKVAVPAKAGVPVTDQSYILSQGQRQDDIEVVKIDDKAGIITFNNHGETQQLPLVVTPPSSTPAVAPTGSLGGGPGAGPGGRFNSGAGAGRLGVGGVSSGNAGNNAGNNPNDGSNLRNVPTRNNTFNAASQVPAGLTEDVQTIAIEAGRLQAQQQGNPVQKIFPITELTEQATGGGAAPSP